MSNALDLLVDGEIVTEALVLVQTYEGEQLMYAGKGSLKALHETLISITKNFEYAEYCIICFSDKKYVAIRITPKKYLILTMKCEFPAEQYIMRILKLFSKLRSMFKDNY
ncbi:MAG: hypothetical protein J7L98_01675, partial [Candidatus Verstraetearchaeota archaeon]|nr:hypothetical protein [Candidatus Verstraetearchaeota archaeon]